MNESFVKAGCAQHPELAYSAVTFTVFKPATASVEQHYSAHSWLCDKFPKIIPFSAIDGSSIDSQREQPGTTSNPILDGRF
jgi:hypothetical protein